jgi:hypothetical protein
MTGRCLVGRRRLTTLSATHVPTRLAVIVVSISRGGRISCAFTTLAQLATFASAQLGFIHGCTLSRTSRRRLLRSRSTTTFTTTQFRVFAGGFRTG